MRTWKFSIAGILVLLGMNAAFADTYKEPTCTSDPKAYQFRLIGNAMSLADTSQEEQDFRRSIANKEMLCLVPVKCPVKPKEKNQGCFRLKNNDKYDNNKSLLFFGETHSKGKPKSLQLYPDSGPKATGCDEYDSLLCSITGLDFGLKNGKDSVTLTYRGKHPYVFPTEARWNVTERVASKHKRSSKNPGKSFKSKRQLEEERLEPSEDNSSTTAAPVEQPHE